MHLLMIVESPKLAIKCPFELVEEHTDLVCLESVYHSWKRIPGGIKLLFRAKQTAYIIAINRLEAHGRRPGVRSHDL